MFIQDLIVGPFYFILILLIGFFFKNKMKDPLDAKYFINGLILKCIGAFFVFIVYFFYYKAGDTVYYFRRAKFIDSILFEDFSVGLKLLFANPAIYDSDTYGYFSGLSAFDTSSFIIARLCAITNIVSFDSYLGNALIFSALSYYGVWKLYKLFSKLYPSYKKYIAYSFLFIPSVFFWGSGVFKDCVTLGFLGLLTNAIYEILVLRKNIIINIFFLIISVYIVGVIKSYILLALLPSIVFWIFFEFRNKIEAKFLKTMATPLFVILTLLLGGFSLQFLSSSFSKFNINNMQQKAEDMQRWHLYTVEVLQEGKGSAYNLGDVSFTPTGILKKIPAGINVAIFRPYLWEVSSPIMLLSAVESLIMLILTLKMIWLILKKPGAFFSYLNQNASLIFMILFSLIFAFSVGFTSYNFGALSRYRIPLLPFYLAFVLIVSEHLKSLAVKRK